MKHYLLSVIVLACAGASGGLNVVNSLRELVPEEQLAERVDYIKTTPALQVGFGEADVTPKLGKDPVYMAGFGQNRKATKIHDPLFVRAVVLKDGNRKIALASVDLVGFFHANVLNVRKQLPGFHYVLISSTHNHAGPDTL